MKSKSGSKSGKILFPSNLRENGCERFKDTFFRNYMFIDSYT